MALIRLCIRCPRSRSPNLAFAVKCCSTVPRITVPQAMVDKLYKKKVKLMEKKAKEIKPTGPVVIHCKKKELNHHRGQKYKKFGTHNLASAHWKNRKHFGDYFTVNAMGKNPAQAVQDTEFSTFEDTGLREDICQALLEYDIKSPTNIQSLTIPEILSGKNILCTAETGSGKTLAYLLPMVQAVLENKEVEGVNGKTNYPLGVVIVPSHELADQVHAVANDLAERLDFKVSSICGRKSFRYLNNREQKHMDILIASPGILSKAIAIRLLDMRRLTTLVLDEADTLLDDSFNYIVGKILTRTTSQIAQYHGIKMTENDTSANYEEISDDVANWSESDEPIVVDNNHSYVSVDEMDDALIHNANQDNKYKYSQAVRQFGDKMTENDSDGCDGQSNISLGESSHLDDAVSESGTGLEKGNKLSSQQDSRDGWPDAEDELCESSDELDLMSAELQSTLENALEGSNVGDDVRIEPFRNLNEQSDEYRNELDVVEDTPTNDMCEPSSPVQFCMVGATIPTTIRNTFCSVVPESTIQVVQTKNVHRILPHVVQKFIKVSASTKVELILKLLKSNIRKQTPTIVFCNTIATLKFLMHTLQECGVAPVSVLYSDKFFGYHREGVFEEWESGKTDILLCTDLGSRGLDTVRARVVVNYDFPRFMSDYIHRAGRVGRVGSDGTGIVVNYVQKKWDVDLLWEIEEATRRDRALNKVDANIKGHHERRHKEKREKKQTHVQLHV